MKHKTTSWLIGAAVAALVIAPSGSGYGQTGTAMAAPPHGAGPQSNGSWQTAPVRSFNSSNVKLEDVVGTVIVAVKDSGPMTVEVSGTPWRVNDVHISQDGDLLHIECASDGDDDNSVWDWHKWFDFSQNDDRRASNLFVKVTVPRGADVKIADLVGNAYVGDTMGAFQLDAAVSRAKIGKVESAKIEIGGTGNVNIASVADSLDIDLGGSGKVVSGPAGSVKIDIGGSGDAQFGAIAGGLSADIAGSGDVSAASVDGPTRLDIAGSGTVRIAGGVANPLHLDIMGAGNLYFGGVAIDPHIDAAGSGNVHIKSYRGHLDSEGMADVKIGD